eukprot:gene13261-biopygen14082
MEGGLSRFHASKELFRWMKWGWESGNLDYKENFSLDEGGVGNPGARFRWRRTVVIRGALGLSGDPLAGNAVSPAVPPLVPNSIYLEMSEPVLHWFSPKSAGATIVKGDPRPCRPRPRAPLAPNDTSNDTLHFSYHGIATVKRCGLLSLAPPTPGPLSREQARTAGGPRRGMAVIGH